MTERAPIDQDLVEEIADVMRLLSDPTRLRVLSLLQPGEMNVTSLCGRLDLAQPTVSHHLGLLRAAGLVRTRREGKQIFYSLNPEYLQLAPTGLRLSSGTVDVMLGFRAAVPRPLANGTAHYGRGLGQAGNGSLASSN